ncbi:MAG: hypothetical protein QNJ57_00470 [Flavobacteriaceae bacterium]|nr:hypothetical protein [Flavobacteriaceae bacterium]
MLKNINLKSRLLEERSRMIKQTDMQSWLQSIFDDLDIQRESILQTLSNAEDDVTNHFDIDKVEVDRIFHIDQIRKICIDYRLRFLETKYFKGDFPANAISKIRQLEQEHTTKLDGFKIVAPSKLFVLKKADDPLLFAPMGNGYYYLIYKWGNDIHPLRKLLVWPLKNVGNLTFSTFISCLLLTYITSNFFFNGKATIAYDIMLFLFYFKFAVGYILFYGIASGKSFNEFIWKSPYNKVR